jgi:hypothetical protein
LLVIFLVDGYEMQNKRKENGTNQETGKDKEIKGNVEVEERERRERGEREREREKEKERQ